MLENQRRGNFVRIYPTKNSDYYDCFLSGNKQIQQTVYYYLYSEVFPSFKNFSKQVFTLEKMEKAQRKSQVDSSKFHRSDNRRIARELLLEYLRRVLAMVEKGVSEEV